MLDPFDLRSGQAIGPFLGSHGFQQTQCAVGCRARLDCEPGFERADAGARGGDSASEYFCGCECAFWKEEPSLRDALFLFQLESIREVYVVPNFISEGYFTQTVEPRELELMGRSRNDRMDKSGELCAGWKSFTDDGAAA